MEDLVIYGCGGLGKVIEQIVFDINHSEPQWNLLGYVDDDQSKHGQIIAGYPVLGGLDFFKSKFYGLVAIGFSNPEQRQQCSEKLASVGIIDYPTLIHPQAWISRRVRIGHGTVIYPGVYIDVDVTIGTHNILNKLCTVGHDSRFGNFVTAAPGVNFGGNIKIGNGCDFGINSATVQGITVGEWATIGGGAIVTNDIPSHCTAVGIPAKPIKFHSR